MNVFLHQFDLKMLSDLSKNICYARYADDWLFAIKPGFQEAGAVQSTIQEVMAQLQLDITMTIFPRRTTGVTNPCVTLGVLVAMDSKSIKN